MNTALRSSVAARGSGWLKQQCKRRAFTSGKMPFRPQARNAVKDCCEVVATSAAIALLWNCGSAQASELFTLSDIDAATAHSIEVVLRPVLTLSTFLFIVRIPMTWYPTIDGTKFPWNIAYTPTEPILKGARSIIAPVGGVDVSPIVLVALISFFNEILLGPQGILSLIQRQG